ncbi:MAG: hypothetical protein G3M70_17370 [Candidatus Nitronauta litoralis]|uniref:Uncharacterized protein n=1 Tax=Candidatus Nitronauta litoralis TaxID=2705533 RepID=A0A7T0BZ05_9BACT|nr:MAG: hypothetical protein G3M70_17370 [Candidatus Nitronauta litoralis]
MKKFTLVSIMTVVALCFAMTAYAGTINPGDKTECNNANSITLEAQGTSNAGDRSNANAVVWKSVNATTVPITLGPAEHNGFEGERKVGMANKHSMGHKKVVLTKQNEFSRGDSIGDISGLVRITNTGTVPISVTCG